jgi:hypothetical protein
MRILNTRDEYIEFISSLLPENPKVLEVGVEAGHLSKKLMKVLKPSELHLLDPWEFNANGKIYSEGHMKNTPTAHSSVNMQIAIERYFEKEIKEGKVFIHRGYSFDLVDNFENGYFDFVYLDGCHLYESVKQDVSDFIAKVNHYGILGGHDYITKETMFTQQGVLYSNQLGYGIAQAVDEFLQENSQLEMIGVVTDECPSPDWAIMRKEQQ